MTLIDRLGIAEQIADGVRKDLYAIAKAAPDDWNGIQLRHAVQIVAARYEHRTGDKRDERKARAAVETFIYNSNL